MCHCYALTHISSHPNHVQEPAAQGPPPHPTVEAEEGAAFCILQPSSTRANAVHFTCIFPPYNDVQTVNTNVSMHSLQASPLCPTCRSAAINTGLLELPICLGNCSSRQPAATSPTSAGVFRSLTSSRCDSAQGEPWLSKQSRLCHSQEEGLCGLTAGSNPPAQNP